MDKVKHVQCLLNSYRDLVGKELIERGDSNQEDYNLIEAEKLVLVSHNGNADPILNYGNPSALQLWELSWEEFVQTPSRKTAEEDLQEKRAEMLEMVQEKGWFSGYEGVRISASGARFLIKNVVIWNVVNSKGEPIGQAATFEEVEYL